ncbi:hypothetical protein Tco_0980505, partial [Tanacetum coccineum]
RGRTNSGNNNYAHSTGHQPHVWGPIAPWDWTMPPCPYPTSAWTRPTYLNGSQGILGLRPQQTYAASVAPTTSYAPTDIETAMHTMTLNPPNENWYMDTGATSHMTASPGKLWSYFNLSDSKHIIVGNGHKIPIRGYGHTTLRHSSRPLFLKNVLHAPTLIKNLVSVCRLSVDDNISLDFDPHYKKKGL